MYDHFWLTLLIIAVEWTFSHFVQWPGWIETTIEWLGGFALVVGSIFLIPPVTSLIAGLYPQPASAAVFIKHRPDRDLSSQVTQIKALVVNSIEGLSYDNVTVALFPADGLTREPAPAAGTPVVATSSALFVPLLAGGAAGVLALGGGGLLYRHRGRHKK